MDKWQGVGKEASKPFLAIPMVMKVGSRKVVMRDRSRCGFIICEEESTDTE
jgi:hypothetical protein